MAEISADHSFVIKGEEPGPVTLYLYDAPAATVNMTHPTRHIKGVGHHIVVYDKQDLDAVRGVWFDSVVFNGEFDEDTIRFALSRKRVRG